VFIDIGTIASILSITAIFDFAIHAQKHNRLRRYFLLFLKRPLDVTNRSVQIANSIFSHLLLHNGKITVARVLCVSTISFILFYLCAAYLNVVNAPSDVEADGLNIGIDITRMDSNSIAFFLLFCLANVTIDLISYKQTQSLFAMASSKTCDIYDVFVVIFGDLFLTISIFLFFSSIFFSIVGYTSERVLRDADFYIVFYQHEGVTGGYIAGEIDKLRQIPVYATNEEKQVFRDKLIKTFTLFGILMEPEQADDSLDFLLKDMFVNQPKITKVKKFDDLLTTYHVHGEQVAYSFWEYFKNNLVFGLDFLQESIVNNFNAYFRKNPMHIAHTPYTLFVYSDYQFPEREITKRFMHSQILDIKSKQFISYTAQPYTTFFLTSLVTSLIAYICFVAFLALMLFSMFFRALKLLARYIPVPLIPLSSIMFLILTILNMLGLAFSEFFKFYL